MCPSSFRVEWYFLKVVVLFASKLETHSCNTSLMYSMAFLNPAFLQQVSEWTNCHHRVQHLACHRISEEERVITDCKGGNNQTYSALQYNGITAFLPKSFNRFLVALIVSYLKFMSIENKSRLQFLVFLCMLCFLTITSPEYVDKNKPHKM